MAKNFSSSQIRSYLDNLGYSTRVSERGNPYTVLSADNDFDHDVIIFFEVDGSWVRVYGFASDFEVQDQNKGRALLKINQLNKDYKLPKGYLEDDMIVAECQYLLDEDVSEEYVKQNVLRSSSVFIWKFFCNFVK